MAESRRPTAVPAAAQTQGRKRWSLPPRSETHPSPHGPEQETESKLTVPFRGHISGGLEPGKKVVLVGIVDAKPDRFYVALTCGRGSGREPPPDVALELCVRFRDRQVLRRACVGGSWGDAERAVPYFPFIKGLPFKMELRCELGRLRVLVDGQQLFDFQHRLSPLSCVDTLWIKGSLTLTKLA